MIIAFRARLRGRLVGADGRAAGGRDDRPAGSRNADRHPRSRDPDRHHRRHRRAGRDRNSDRHSAAAGADSHEPRHQPRLRRPRTSSFRCWPPPGATPWRRHGPSSRVLVFRAIISTSSRCRMPDRRPCTSSVWALPGSRLGRPGGAADERRRFPRRLGGRTVTFGGRAPGPALPAWIRSRRLQLGELHQIKKRMRSGGLHTVCEEARCPNRTECFSRGTATFLINGRVCTRNCSYCSIAHGRPSALDPDEPRQLVEAVSRWVSSTS